jgi:uncharacterized protein YnzC (UPF0291/DUF896 family)
MTQENGFQFRGMVHRPLSHIKIVDNRVTGTS